MTKSNIKIRPAKFKEIIGTGRIGTVCASFDQLKVALGEPHDRTVPGEWESRDKKTKVEWTFVLKCDKEIVFTVYDFKSNKLLDDVNQWSLGGKEKNNKIKEFLESKGISVDFC